jgi:hypothetical protein
VIHDILRRRSGYKFLTKIDLTMCYHTYELDDGSAKFLRHPHSLGKIQILTITNGNKRIA